MNEKEQKQQNNMMKTTVGVTVGKIVEASTTKDVDQSLIEVRAIRVVEFSSGG